MGGGALDILLICVEGVDGVPPSPIPWLCLVMLLLWKPCQIWRSLGFNTYGIALSCKEICNQLSYRMWHLSWH